MERFKAVQPTLLATTLNPSYGDRYFPCHDRIPNLVLDRGPVSVSHAMLLHVHMHEEVRREIFGRVLNCIHEGGKTLQTILDASEGGHSPLWLIHEEIQRQITKSAAARLVRTCAESALQEDPIVLCDYLWSEAMEHARQNKVASVWADSIIVHYIEHCLIQLRGAEIMRAIARL